MSELPYVCADLPPTGGALRARPEDFVVEEIPAYEPAGAGEHLYVRFEKRGITTPQAVRALALALGVDPAGAGWAGLKDRHAVTTQTASFPGGDAARALALDLPGIRVLDARRHGNKLRNGHLRGNRFELRLRGAHPDAQARAEAIRGRLAALGAPNYYGAQRFGREGDNAARGRAWLAGGPAPREHFLRKLYASAVQSALFNDYLGRRVADGLMARYVPGDLAVRHPGTRPFAIEPASADEEYAALRCSPTGPIFGPKMPTPTGDAAAREADVLRAAGIELALFARARSLAEGARRATRVCPDDLAVRAEQATPDGPPDLVLTFSLPAGGYATSLVREFRRESSEGGDASPEAPGNAAENASDEE